MSDGYIPAELRRAVAARARGFCEYCLLHEDDANFFNQIDHIISLKHGGQTTAENLAVACLACNRAKGSDIGSLVRDGFTRFFNPRTDRWFDHSEIAPGASRIIPLTDIGTATARILGFNLPERVQEREQLSAAGRYPLPGALLRIEAEPQGTG